MKTVSSCRLVLGTCRLGAARALALLPFLLAACGGGDEQPAQSDPASAQTPMLTSITVSPATANLGVGLSVALTAEAKDQNGAVMPGVAFS